MSIHGAQDRPVGGGSVLTDRKIDDWDKLMAEKRQQLGRWLDADQIVYKGDIGLRGLLGGVDVSLASQRQNERSRYTPKIRSCPSLGATSVDFSDSLPESSSLSP